MREPTVAPSQSDRSALNQLADVFAWCEHQGIELAFLGVSRHLPKYCEAGAYLKQKCYEELLIPLVPDGRFLTDEGRTGRRAYALTPR